MRCAIPGCRAASEPDAPLPLCTPHLAEAGAWATRLDGIEDLLPARCAVCGSGVGIRYPSGWACAVCDWRPGDVPDPELVPPRVDIVYYLRFGDRVKIGTTASPRQRFAALAARL